MYFAMVGTNVYDRMNEANIAMMIATQTTDVDHRQGPQGYDEDGHDDEGVRPAQGDEDNLIQVMPS